MIFLPICCWGLCCLTSRFNEGQEPPEVMKAVEKQGGKHDVVPEKGNCLATRI